MCLVHRRTEPDNIEAHLAMQSSGFFPVAARRIQDHELYASLYPAVIEKNDAGKSKFSCTSLHNDIALKIDHTCERSSLRLNPDHVQPLSRFSPTTVALSIDMLLLSSERF